MGMVGVFEFGIIYLTRVDADGSPGRVVAFRCHWQGLDVLIEFKGLIQLEKGDVVGDDAGIVTLMLPHVDHLPLLGCVLRQDCVDVVRAGYDLEPTFLAARYAVSSADNVRAVYNSGSTCVVVVRPDVKVLQGDLPRELVGFSFLPTNNARLDAKILWNRGADHYGGQKAEQEDLQRRHHLSDSPC